MYSFRVLDFMNTDFKNVFKDRHRETGTDTVEANALLDQEKSSFDSGHDYRGNPTGNGRSGSRRLAWICLEVAAVISGLTLAFAAGQRFRPSWESFCIDTEWQVAKANVQFGRQEFNPRFEGPPSEYMGVPGPELDQRWYQLSNMYTYGIPHSTLERMNRTKGAVQYPGEDSYMVGLEAFHQLHCLNYVRMYTEKAHYETFDFDMIAESEDERRDHKNHCVEVLRQKLMCQPDLNVYSYHWVGHHDLPLANLHTPHGRCIDWDAFVVWQATEHRNGRHLFKPEGAEVLY